ncbi:hypothetical protein FZC84_19850 [Rossellomorea vietnamensis]|uniref:Uncharacterized protein n=1 Tax=Rossellomorea vietnamensis TaxID=218284 RepID=A0A5D4M5W1_9BACI|nr:hypothetical protein [Rossellomorea vietnamensis]TYR96733.1 hypothetical protein FZC84_19850 [Rossellomorea vietnamensis]
MRKVLSLAALTILLTACGAQNDNLYVQDEDQGGRRFVNNDLNDVDTNQNVDQPMETNQNPNFIDLAETQPNKGTDVNKARDVIEEYTDFEPGQVWLNGQQMWVTAYTHDEMAQDKRNKEEAELGKRLTRAFPRYKVNVQIHER